MKKQTTVILGITGSIAAYKSCELVRLCIKEGWDVHVVMTTAATEFVTPLTFQTLSRNPVGVEEFAQRTEWKPNHISFADLADVFVIAPCSANTLAKVSLGLADNLLTSLALANPAPMLIAPTMNERMWQHPATQGHVATLTKRKGVTVMMPGCGELACGVKGDGRMPEPEEIFGAIKKILKKK